MIKIAKIYTTDWMKKFIIYFPVILVSGQVASDILFLANKTLYYRLVFYISALFGVNIAVAIFFLLFTFAFRFCEVSRACAGAQILFNINYIIIQEDNLYNILFQVIIGALALLYTYRYFINKFPLCSISMVHKFVAAVIKSKCRCKEAVRRWEVETTELLTQKISHAGNSKNYR